MAKKCHDSGMLPVETSYRRSLLILAALILVVVLFHRLQEFWVPMNHDLGTYGYSAQEILRGDVVYRDIWNHKTPGLLYFYAALFRIFPDTPLSMQIAATIWLFLTLLVFYAATPIFFEKRAIWIATLLFAFHASLPWWSDGGGLMEHFMLLPMIGAAAYFLRGIERNRLFDFTAAGFFAALAFWIKQPSLTVAAAMVAPLMMTIGRFGLRRTLRAMLSLFLGAAILLVPWVITLALHGSLGLAWEQMFGYNATVYVREHYWFRELQVLFIFLYNFRFSVVLSVAAAVGAISLMRRKLTPRSVFLLSWAVLDVAMIFVENKFFRHHFLQLVPSFSILAGIAFQRMEEMKACQRRTLWILVALILGSTELYYIRNAARLYETRIVRQERNDAERTAAWLDVKSTEAEPVFVWGTDPVVYFLACREAPGSFYDLDPIMIPGRPEAAHALIKEFIARPPRFIVDVTAGSEINNTRYIPLDPARPLPADPTPGFDRDLLRPVVAWVRSRYAPIQQIGAWTVWEARP